MVATATGLALVSVQALDWRSRAQTDLALARPLSQRPEYSLRPDLMPWPAELAFVRPDALQAEVARSLKVDETTFVSVTNPDTGEVYRLRFFQSSPQVIELRYQRESSSELTTGLLLAAGYFLMLAFFAMARRQRHHSAVPGGSAVSSQDWTADSSVPSSAPEAETVAPNLASVELPVQETSNKKVVVIVPTSAPAELRLAVRPRLEPEAVAVAPVERKPEIEKPIAIGLPPIPSNRQDATRALSFRLKSPMIFLAYSARDSALVLECEAGFSSDDISPHRLQPRVPFELDLRVFSDVFEESVRVFEESLPISRFLLNRYGVAFFEAIPWVRALSEIDPRVGNRFQGIFVVLQPGLESLSLKGQIRSQLSETWSDDDSKTEPRTENPSVTRPRDPLA